MVSLLYLSPSASIHRIDSITRTPISEAFTGSNRTEEEALEEMHGALQLAEAATDELGAVTEELAGELDSGVAMEIEMLCGNIADMQNLSDEGNSAELMELAAGTSEAMSQLTHRLE